MRYIILLLIASFMFSCSDGEKGSNKNILYVEVACSKIEVLSNTLDAVGNIKGKEEVQLYSKVDGKLVKYLLNDGDIVNLDQAVALVDRDQTGYKYHETPVLSTIAGKVGCTYLDEGERVFSNITPVALIFSSEQVKAVANINEKYLPLVSKGLDAYVAVEAYPGKDFQGTVDKIGALVDETSRTFPVEVVIDNEDGFLAPGMYAYVKIVLEEIYDAILLPEEAIFSYEDGWGVYVVNQEDIAYLRLVELGTHKDGKVQIKQGIHPEDKVVISGHHRLRDGVEVKVKEY